MKYSIVRELGSGATGTVYLGQDKSSKLVAIKIISDEKLKTRRRSIVNEIYISKLLKCRHKNIACFVESGTTIAGDIAIITEYIGDVTLYDMKLKRILIRFEENKVLLLDIAYQLADGLEFMHNIGVAHRDIKPHNIVLKDHIPVYIDFDLSCVVNSKEHCMIGRVRTPNYMAPEVWRNDPNIDLFKSDIYSLGVLFYFLFNSRRLPYISETIKELKNEILNHQPYPSYSGDKELDQLTFNMRSRNPDERPTPSEIKDKLQELIKGSV